MSKHASGKYSGKEKNNVNIIPFLIIIIAIIVIIGTVFYLKKQNDIKKAPERSINNLFTSLKELNTEEATRYIDYNQLIASLDEMILNQEEESKLDIENELFKDINWNIKDIKSEKGTTVATVEVTNKNFKNIMTKWIRKIVSDKSLGKELTNELALLRLDEVLKEENDYNTTTKEIIMNKIDGNWKVQINDDFRNLVFPGIDSLATVLNNK